MQSDEALGTFSTSMWLATGKGFWGIVLLEDGGERLLQAA
jgi:hypothetical protein